LDGIVPVHANGERYRAEEPFMALSAAAFDRSDDALSLCVPADKPGTMKAPQVKSAQARKGVAFAPKAKGEAAAARRAAMIERTRELIGERGLPHVSLNEILRSTGGSKATVTKYFGNKDGLIAAALEGLAREHVAPLTMVTRPGAGEDLETALIAVLTAILSLYLRPEALASYRGVIASVGQGHHVADIFYRHGEMIVIQELAHFLAGWAGKGIRSDLDPQIAADQLAHMLRGGLFTRALLGVLPGQPTDDEIGATATAAARLFLRGAGDTSCG
jgi:AcrR family transcriptional regulator